jgi:hypothetical protein
MTTAHMPPLVSELKEKKIRKSVWFWGNSTRLSDFLHRNLVHEVSDSNKTAGYHYLKTGRFYGRLTTFFYSEVFIHFTKLLK